MTTTSPQDQLIEAATDLFHAEYTRLAQPVVRGMDEAEYDDCVRGALEAVIALVQRQPTAALCGQGLAMRGHGWITCQKAYGHEGPCAR